MISFIVKKIFSLNISNIRNHLLFPNSHLDLSLQQLSWPFCRGVLQTSQIFKMEYLAIAKHSILGLRQGSEYTFTQSRGNMILKMII